MSVCAQTARRAVGVHTLNASCNLLASLDGGTGDGGASDAASPASPCDDLVARCANYDVCRCDVDDAGGVTFSVDDTAVSCWGCYGAPPVRLERLRA
jgi:hypothetical protein